METKEVRRLNIFTMVESAFDVVEDVSPIRKREVPFSMECPMKVLGEQ